MTFRSGAATGLLLFAAVAMVLGQPDIRALPGIVLVQATQSANTTVKKTKTKVKEKKTTTTTQSPPPVHVGPPDPGKY